MATWRHIRAIAVLPFMVTVVIPTVLVCMTGPVNPGRGLPEPLGLAPRAVGIGLICLGLTLMARTISLFATFGRGTLAPWDPAERLVVRGIYRHVRNPMISGVCSVLLGEAVALGSVPIGAWFLIFLAGNLIYIPLVEERDLERRFGQQYALYKAGVPGWIPRLKPWQVPWDDAEKERR